MRLDRKGQSGWWIDACAIYALTVGLILPLFRLKYLANWGSIESSFISDGRMLRENWPHHLWQPQWYLGTRADYVYPPGLRGGVALLSWMLHTIPAHAYHICIALLYAFGIVAAYLWVRTATGFRGPAWLTAAAVALTSPSFIIAPDVLGDSPLHVPWRLHVLMSYGEGPHISSLSVLPIVWLAGWRRFQGGGIGWLLLSAGTAALVVTLNFYGATALAITFPILAWVCFLEQHDWRVLRDSVSIAALAYGLTAWWLVPSYLQITTRNLRLVAPETRASSAWIAAAVGLGYIGVTLAIRRRIALPAYRLFVWSVLSFLTLYVFGFRWFGLQVAGNSKRLIPEWELFAILCAVGLALEAWRWRPTEGLQLVPRIGLSLLLLVCFWPSCRYIEHAYSEFRADPQWQSRVEYLTEDWLWRNFPDERTFVTGTIRYWYNVWHNGAQAGGGSDQGLLNPLMPAAAYGISQDMHSEFVLSWLQALGVDIVVIPGKSSQEPFKEFSNSLIYERKFPLLRDDGAGNRFYRVPRRSTGIVRLVDRNKLAAARPVPEYFEAPQILMYAAAVESVLSNGDGPDRPQARWRGSDELDIEAAALPGQTLLVQETYDPYWRAYVDDQPRPIWRDALGLIALDLRPGKHSIRMVFETPRECYVGYGVSIASLVLMAFVGLRRRSKTVN